METVKGVLLGLMVLAVILVATFAVLIPIKNAAENVDTNSVSVHNETTAVPGSEDTTPFLLNIGNVTLYNYRNVICTVVRITNSTSPAVISSGNYSASTDGCTLTKLDNAGGPNYTMSKWNVTYTATYDNPMSYNVVMNITSGGKTFFANVPTFFTLLGVVVLILIIAIVIIAVTRFQGGGGIGGMKGGGKVGEPNV